MIALHPDGVKRAHGEWRVSRLGGPESNLGKLKSALSLMTRVDWQQLGARHVRMCGITKIGTLRHAENEFLLQQYMTRCDLFAMTKRLLTLVQMTHVMTMR